MISGMLTLRMSPGTMRTLSYALSVSLSTAGSFLSSSTAVTSAPASARPCVSVPMPGPISRTRSPGLTSAASTMPCTMRASMRKFWPSFLLMRRPNALRMCIVTSRLAIFGCSTFSSSLFMTLLLLSVLTLHLLEGAVKFFSRHAVVVEARQERLGVGKAEAELLAKARAAHRGIRSA